MLGGVDGIWVEGVLGVVVDGVVLGVVEGVLGVVLGGVMLGAVEGGRITAGAGVAQPGGTMVEL
jgi:hypothetical protein